MATYYIKLTTAGLAALAAAQSSGTQLQIAQFAVGDSGGAYYDPTEAQTALVSEKWRAAVNRVYIHPNNSNWVVVEALIPATDGGFDIREAGAFAADGTLIAVGKYPLTNKPAPGSGSEKDLYIRMIMQVSNAADVQQTIDQSLVLATKEYVDSKDFKESVIAATTANITLSGLQTVDGVALAVDNRVLVKNQTTGSQNGIYIVKSTAWIRDFNCDTSLELTPNLFVIVEKGTTNADTGWMLTTDGPITVGSTALVFKKMLGDWQPLAANLTALAGLVSAADKLGYFTGSGTAALTTLTAFARTLLDDADAATMRTTLGLAAAALLNVGTTAGTVAAGDHNHTLDALSNTTIASNTAGEILKWNGSAWVNNTLAEAGIQPAGSYQPLDATLTALAAIATAADKIIYATGSDTFSTATLTAFARTLLDDADAAASRTTLGLGGAAVLSVGTTAGTVAAGDHLHTGVYQPLDAELTAIAGLTSAADRFPYFTGNGTAALATLTSFARTLLDDTTAAAARTTLGAQASDATLTALAGLTTAADQMIYSTGADTFTTAGLTAFARTLLDDADAATALTTLGAAAATTIGSSKDVVSYYSGPQTLDASHIGKLIILQSSYTGAVNLPLSTGVASGSKLTIWNGTTSLITLNRAGSELIWPNGTGGLAALSIQGGECIDLIAFNGIWVITSGGFGASLTASGYQKLPSGLIIQWGTGQETGGNQVWQYFNLPVAYPNAHLCAWASSGSNGSYAGAINNSLTQIGVFASSNLAVHKWLSVGY